MDNHRSLISLWNLCDLLERCITHPHAAGETFLAADGEDLSTPELMRHLARGLNKPARLFPFPPGLLYSGARLLGQEAMIDRLCGSLQVDIGKARQVLGWTPPVSVEEGLERTARHFRRSSHTVPTPRGGGVAIVLTFLMILPLLGLVGELPAAALVAVGRLDGVLGVVMAYAPLIWLAVRFKAGAREWQEV